MNVKRLKVITLALLLTLTIIVPQTGCAAKEVSGSDFLLNTVCEITLYDGSDEKLIADTFNMCREYENRLSRTIASSEIGEINGAGGEWVDVHPTTAEVIQKGILYGVLSQGLFDITVGDLSDLWNFSGENPQVPDAEALAEAVKHVDYKKIQVEELKDGKDKGIYRVRVTDPDSRIDLGGIAKGFIADRAAEYLRSKGVTAALLNFGGNVVCIGEKTEGAAWKIGVEKPFSKDAQGNRQILGVVEAGADQTVVTSGTYERQFVQDGKQYYHILDPRTGYPMDTDLDGVTIVGIASVDCDGLSTTCLVLGREKATELIESLDGVEAVFVGKDRKVTMTDGIKWTEQK